MATNKTLAKRKQSKNKSRKNKLRSTSFPIWDNYGHVLNTKTNKYVRLGSNESMKVIYELEHDAEWKKRVEYIMKNHGVFGRKLANYLQNKE